MPHWLEWLLGVESPPDWIRGPDSRWHVEFRSLPEGNAAALAIAAALVCVAGVWWLYRREGRSLGLGQRLPLCLLRLGVLLAVTFMLLEMVVVISKHERVASRLLVLMDTSQSMALADPYPDDSIARETAERIGLKTPDGKPDIAALRKLSRLDLAQKVAAEAWPDLRRGREVSLYSFAGKLELVAEEAALPLADSSQNAASKSGPKSLTAAGQSTAIGDAIHDALALHRGQTLAGILLVTDGQSNGGLDARAAAAAAGKAGVPIVSLAAGTAEGPRNVRLAGIETSPVVFLRDPADLAVLVESRGLKDAPASVLLEQRQDDGSWKEVGREPVVLGEDAALKRVNFRITPEALGQLDFRARVTDAGPELTEDDNLDTASIKVVRQTIRVLLVAGYPAAEVQFLRNALLRDTGMEFASWLQSAAPGYDQIGARPIRRLPANQKELDHFDTLILFDPDMRNLGPAWPEMLTKFVGEAGGGLIYIAGELNSQKWFNPESGDGTSLGVGDAASSWLRILPVVRDSGLYQSAADVRLSSRETWTLELTPEGNTDRIFQFASESSRNREVLTSLPGMFWHFPVTRAKPGATVLARHGDPRMRNQFGRHVLMATQLYGPGRTVFIGFDSTYRWRYLHEEYFDGFWARLIDRVGRSKVLGGRYPFTLATDKAAYRAGDRVTVHAEIVPTADDTAAISALHGDVDWGPDASLPLEFEPLPDNPGVLEASFVAGEPGAYTARVLPGSTAGALESGLRPATLAFRVEPPRAERDNPTLDRPLLEELARLSGGGVLTPAEQEKLPAAFQVREVDRPLTHTFEVWNAPLLYGAVVLLLTAEWLLRKRHRMA
ncbi:MAG TPA: vWA domain-containing protein [Pirellulales bacterium]